MAKEIVIENFLKMSPQIPQYSDKNQNFLIAGSYPLYYLDYFPIQEEQIAPLVASPSWVLNTAGTIEGNVVDIIPCLDGSFDVFVITDKTHVYGISNYTGITSLGYPTGVVGTDSSCRLAIAGGYLFAILPNTTSYPFKMDLVTHAWTNLPTSITSSTMAHYVEPFLDYIALSDASSGYNTTRMVRKIDVTAFTTTPDATSLDLGKGWGVLRMRNYNNKYLAIAGAPIVTQTNEWGYSNNYIFLWDGISSRYNYSMKVPGKFVDMLVIDTVLYVLVQSSSMKHSIYYMSGTTLKKFQTLQFGIFDHSPFSTTNEILFNFKNYIGVQLIQTNDLPQYSLAIFGKDDIGQIEFVLCYGKQFGKLIIGNNGNLFTGLGNNMYSLDTNGIGINFEEIFYKSQWIPIKNLQAIDIYYDTPPQSGTDAINVTIYGKGEDIIAGSSTTVLASITPTTILNQSRTRLDVKGFTGDKVMVMIQTVNSTWRPIIRKIKLITK